MTKSKCLLLVWMVVIICLLTITIKSKSSKLNEAALAYQNYTYYYQKYAVDLHIGWNYLNMEPYNPAQTPRMLRVHLSHILDKDRHYQSIVRTKGT